jgi:hypothetical protein
VSITVTVGETNVSVTVSPETAVAVVASGGIGPAGFLTAPGTATNAFGTFQLVPGPGITMSTSAGVFLLSSWGSTDIRNLSSVLSVAGRTGTVTLVAGDVTAGTFDIARLPTIGYTALSGVPTSFASAPHTHDAADVQSGVFSINRIPTIGYTALSGVPTAFVAATHTHDAADIQSGTLSINRIPAIGYTALSGVPSTFAPSAHTHSTSDVVSFTAAAAAAAPVQSVQGQTGAVSLVAADLTAAAATHSHDAADVTSGKFDIARIPTIGYTALSGVPTAFSPATHTHDASDVQAGTFDVARIPTIGYTAIGGVPTTFSPSSHTHDAADVQSGTFNIDRIPTIGYTALSGVPSTFAPDTSIANVVSVNGITGTPEIVAGAGITVSTASDQITIEAGSSLPDQAGYDGPLVTDGTAATWTSRFNIVSPVLVQGAGMTFSTDTALGQITIAFAGGTSGVTVGSATPQNLGTAAAGSSANASREDHVHKLPTVADITAAAAVHTHDAADVQSGTLDIARLPAIGYTALSGVPTAFTAAAHTHDAVDVVSGVFDAARIPAIGYTALSGVPTAFSPDTAIANVASVNGLTGTLTIAAGVNITVSTAGTTITIEGSAGGGGGGSSGVWPVYLFGG